MSQGQTVLISLVGYQPAAIAAFLSAWREHREQPASVLLLATRDPRRPDADSWAFAGRLREAYHALPIEVVEIAAGPGQAGAAPTETEAAAAHLRRFPGARAVLFTSPGLSFQVARLARALPEGTVLVEGATDGLALLKGDAVDFLPGVDIGLDRLLALHDLTAPSGGAARPPIDGWLADDFLVTPPGLVQGLRLPTAHGDVICAVVFEKAGWLYLLVAIPDGDAGKDAIRSAQLLRQGGGPFRANVAVTCWREAHAQRARANGLWPVTEHEFQDWLKGLLGQPGEAVVEVDGATALADHRLAGKGAGDGPPLVVWMGTDPSATLNSIVTHRPRSAIVCVDVDTHAAVTAALRLQAIAGELPCNSLYFARARRHGGDLQGALKRALGQLPPPETRLDVTPGTNMQSAALVRLPFGVPWSQDRGSKAAVTLDGSSRIPIESPGVLLQGQMVGGTLVSRGADASTLPAGRVEAMLRLGQELVSRPGGDRPSLLRKRGARYGLEGHDELGTWAKKGDFLEELVACCFLQAGATDVHVGVKWRWSEALQRRLEERHIDRDLDSRSSGPGVRTPRAANGRPSAVEVHRDETDVNVYWQQHFIVVSCKAQFSPQPDPENHLTGHERELTECEAMAKLFGRFALPMVCHLNATPAAIASHVPQQRGATLVPLEVLLDPAALETFVKGMIAARRTTA